MKNKLVQRKCRCGIVIGKQCNTKGHKDNFWSENFEKLL